jgi:hypothetical protein
VIRSQGSRMWSGNSVKQVGVSPISIPVCVSLVQSVPLSSNWLKLQNMVTYPMSNLRVQGALELTEQASTWNPT